MASVTAERRHASAAMRISRFFYRHPHGRLGLLLGGPLSWFLLVYIGSLVVLFLSAFWSVDVFTGETVHNWGLQNFQTLLNGDVYRTITLRTVGLAAAVTLTDIVLAFPLAYYAARLATPRRRNASANAGSRRSSRSSSRSSGSASPAPASPAPTPSCSPPSRAS